MPGPAIPVPAKIENADSVLIVDDEPDIIEAISESVRDFHFHLLATSDPRQALSIIRQDRPLALLITDLFMPRMSGGRLLREARRIRPDLPALLLTGIASPEEFVKWRRRGEHIIGKPWSDEEFRNIVISILSGTSGKSRWTCATD
jgi:CheY-like chemotaxis protein